MNGRVARNNPTCQNASRMYVHPENTLYANLWHVGWGAVGALELVGCQNGTQYIFTSSCCPGRELTLTLCQGLDGKLVRTNMWVGPAPDTPNPGERGTVQANPELLSLSLVLLFLLERYEESATRLDDYLSIYDAHRLTSSLLPLALTQTTRSSTASTRQQPHTAQAFYKIPANWFGIGNFGDGSCGPYSVSQLFLVTKCGMDPHHAEAIFTAKKTPAIRRLARVCRELTVRVGRTALGENDMFSAVSRGIDLDTRSAWEWETLNGHFDMPAMDILAMMYRMASRTVMEVDGMLMDTNGTTVPLSPDGYVLHDGGQHFECIFLRVSSLAVTWQMQPSKICHISVILCP